jgi:hypothetical protein
MSIVVVSLRRRQVSVVSMVANQSTNVISRVVVNRVTLSNLGACLSSNAYMCFYVKRHLDYKPFMKPTYRLARDKDIVREQEQEKLKEMARMREVDDALMATIAGD